MENAGEAITVLDPVGHIQYANAEFASLSGHDHAALDQMMITQIFPPSAEETTKDVREHLDSGRSWRGRFSLGPDESARLVDGSLSPVHDDKTNVLHVVGVFRDVTREAELEVRLRQTEKMQALGQLAGGVAHDFNNLLVVIQGYAEMLQRRLGEDSDSRDSIEQIREAANRAADLTNQLLAFGRRQRLHDRVVSLGDLVDDAFAMIRRLIPENIAIELALESGEESVRVDPSQIHQVLLNLAANARDAMPNGGILRISTRTLTPDLSVQDEVPCVELAVSDTGNGIDAEVLAHIFDPFFTTKGPHEGTGLGLASVYGIVEQSGGSIDVTSAPAEGTTFSIRLPATSERPAPDRAHDVDSSPRLRTERVLLVEDQEAVRKLIRRTLEEEGYRVLVASDGQDALEQVAAEPSPIDILLTDVMMPRVDGPTLAARLRERWPKLRVIFTSGYSPDDRLDVEDPLRHSKFLPKPFGREALLVALSDWGSESQS